MSLRQLAAADVSAMLAIEGDPVRIVPAGGTAQTDEIKAQMDPATEQGGVRIGAAVDGRRRDMQALLSLTAVLAAMQPLGIQRGLQPGDVLRVPPTDPDYAGDWRVDRVELDGGGLCTASCVQLRSQQVGKSRAES